MIHNTPEVNWKFEYVGDIIFRNGYPNRILTDTGHIDMTGPSPVYQWWLTDHLGNVRVVADSLGNISQTNHYDPYGGEIGVKTFTFTMDSLTPYSATENLFCFGAKEWNETFSDYDFLARYFSTNYARFSSQDPLSEKYYHLSPYAYCAGNPIRYIDHTGMVIGDFFDEGGRYIGNDGKNDHKTYVIKTTQQEFDSEVNSAGISRKEAKNTKKFIKDNSGNSSAFSLNSIAYKNSVELFGYAEDRMTMLKSIGDNGRGGMSPSNNREYGGTYKNGTVVLAKPGDISNSSIGASIVLPFGAPTFHSHPSGSDGSTNYRQAPSREDILVSGNNLHYVFAMSEKVVYIYNNKGVIASIPFKSFVK